jgi:hypothetical protein
MVLDGTGLTIANSIAVPIAVVVSFTLGLTVPLSTVLVGGISCFINLILMGGVWGAITFAIPCKSAFVVTEIIAYTMFALRWKKIWHLISIWGGLTIVAIAVTAVYQPDPFSVVAGVLFGIYSRFSSFGPATVFALAITQDCGMFLLFILGFLLSIAFPTMVVKGSIYLGREVEQCVSTFKL